MSQQTLAVLTNDEVIALDQDTLGVQGHRVSMLSSGQDVWAAPLHDGSIGVVLLNRGNDTSDITVQWSDIGLPSGATVNIRDLWAHQSLGSATGSYTSKAIPSHGSVTLKLTPTKPTGYNSVLMPGSAKRTTRIAGHQ